MVSRLLSAGLALALLAGCGPGRFVELREGQTAVRVTASSFSFEPSQILARAGVPLTLQVQNTWSSAHNLTVTDPAGAVLRSVVLPPGELVTVEVPVAGPGVYGFYCNETFHSTLGMKGRIEAR